MLRVKSLSINEYDFSQDSEEPAEKVKKIVEKYKQAKLKVSSTTKAALEVPGLSDSEPETEKRLDLHKKSNSSKNSWKTKAENKYETSDYDDSWSDKDELEEIILDNRKTENTSRRKLENSKNKKPTVTPPIQTCKVASLMSCSQPKISENLRSQERHELYSNKKDTTVFLTSKLHQKLPNNSICRQEGTSSNEISPRG